MTLGACFGIASLIFFRLKRYRAGSTSTHDFNECFGLATVHDKDCKVIKNLTQDDVVLPEDGVSQKIDYFFEEANLPLTVGLLVDASRSQREVLDQERRPSYTFLDDVLRE